MKKLLKIVLIAAMLLVPTIGGAVDGDEPSRSPEGFLSNLGSNATTPSVTERILIDATTGALVSSYMGLTLKQELYSISFTENNVAHNASSTVMFENAIGEDIVVEWSIIAEGDWRINLSEDAIAWASGTAIAPQNYDLDGAAWANTSAFYSGPSLNSTAAPAIIDTWTGTDAARYVDGPRIYHDTATGSRVVVMNVKNWSGAAANVSITAKVYSK